MKNQPKPQHPQQRHCRAGMAPMELVLSLPVFLLLLGAMLIIGNTACWKVRGSVAARHAIWREKYPRTTATDPQPINWPLDKNAGMGVEQAGFWTPHDLFAEQGHVVMRGPVLGTLGVNHQLTDIRVGFKQGQATFDRNWPVYPKMGRYRMNLKHALLTGQSRFTEMFSGKTRIPTNRYRRIPFLYVIPKPGADLVDAYTHAVTELIFAPFRRDLDPLDRDLELGAFHGHFVDFHPRVTGCQLDVSTVRVVMIAPLLERIRGEELRGDHPGVPYRMTNTFLAMYRSQVQQLESLLEQLRNQIPPAPPNAIAEVEAQIAKLNVSIQQLEQFLSTLE